MPKVSWADLVHISAKAHLLVAELEPSFFGGRVATDPFDSQRLREGFQLMGRVCTRLKLDGAHSATTSRTQSDSRVLCLFEKRDDRDKVADLVEAGDVAEDVEGWASRRIFALCTAVHERLVSIGGETDNRYAGRRRRERERNAAAQTLRWGDG